MNACPNRTPSLMSPTVSRYMPQRPAMASASAANLCTPASTSRPRRACGVPAQSTRTAEPRRARPSSCRTIKTTSFLFGLGWSFALVRAATRMRAFSSACGAHWPSGLSRAPPALSVHSQAPRRARLREAVATGSPGSRRSLYSVLKGLEPDTDGGRVAL